MESMKIEEWNLFAEKVKLEIRKEFAGGQTRAVYLGDRPDAIVQSVVVERDFRFNCDRVEIEFLDVVFTNNIEPNILLFEGLGWYEIETPNSVSCDCNPDEDFVEKIFDLITKTHLFQ